MKALKDSGHDVSVAVLKKGNEERYDVVESHLIGSGPLSEKTGKIWGRCFGGEMRKKFLYIWRMPRLTKLSAYICEKRPDVIFVRGQQNMFTLCSLLIARLSCHRVYLFALLNKHSAESAIKQSALFFLRKVLGVSGIVTPLPNIKKSSDPFFYYVPFAVEPGKGNRALDKHEHVRIIAVGKMQRRKDHLLLLRAMKRLKERHNIRLTIVGMRFDDEYQGEVFGFIRDNRLDDIVDVIMNIPNQELLTLYGNYDLFVLPSFNEPAGFVVLEAMAAGLPLIVSDTCGLKGYIEKQKNGAIFISRNEDSLVNVIEAVIKNPRKLKDMGSHSRRLVQEKYLPHCFISNLNDLLKEQHSDRT